MKGKYVYVGQGEVLCNESYNHAVDQLAVKNYKNWEMLVEYVNNIVAEDKDFNPETFMKDYYKYCDLAAEMEMCRLYIEFKVE